MGPRRRAAAWLASGVLAGGVITGVVVSQLEVAGATPSHGTPAAATAQATKNDTSNIARGGDLWHGPLGRLRVGAGAVLHGQFTVKTATGTQVVDVQTGAVTGTTSHGSQHAITVKSSDGYTQTYTVTSSTRIGKNGQKATISDIATGDTVRVFATNDNGTLTAQLIRDGKVPPVPGERAPRSPNGSPSPAPGTHT